MATLPTSTDLAGWTAVELEQMRVTLAQEQERRRIIADAPALVEHINTQVLAATGRTAGLAWVQPTGGHDAYPRGWKVVHKGFAWTSTIPGNPYEPGTTGWTKGAAASAGTAPAAPAWDGSGKAYAKGDRVAYQGKTFVVINGHTSNSSWTPTAAVSLFAAE